ncbi:sensor histidine kinase [Allofournierella sp.]|uniref:sensor histidine kinase n=1 Tax=Allofournierella sp. TaxID=1940256 RepID=UPI003AB7BB5B
MKEKRKRISLRWSLVALVLGCWVLPLVLLLCLSGYYLNRNMYEKVSQVIASTVENQAGISGVQLEQVVNQSISATYTGEIKQAWLRYMSSQDGGLGASDSELYQAINTYLRNQYRNHALVRYSNVQFLSGVDKTVYYYDQGLINRGQYKDHEFYLEKVQGQVLALADSLEGHIAFLNVEGRVYLTRCIFNGAQPIAALTLELEPDILQLGNLIEQGWNRGAVVTVETRGTAGVQGALEDGARQGGAGQEGGCRFVTGEAISPPAFDYDAAGEIEVARVEGKPDFAWIYGRQAADRFTLTYVVEADMTGLLSQSAPYFRTLGAIALLLIPLMASVFLFFHRKINRPVNLLTAASNRIEQGEFGVQVEERKMGSAELEYLGGQFNRMSGQLQNQFERIYREELALRDARIMALQSQINPHFLGNTLEVINWEARLAGDVKVSMMLEALSTILEATMDRSHRSTIRLSEELHYVNAYLTIIGHRLGRRLTVEREIDESLLEMQVPRLVMQPILENAVEHGVGNKQHGVIVIRARRENSEWMSLEVENDSPLTPDAEARIRALLTSEEQPAGIGATSLGIRNVHQRLRILYGEESGLSVKTTKNGSTLSSMRVRLPQA